MTKNKMTTEEIEEVLKGFTGSFHYYPNTSYSRDVHTDGVHWLAEVCESFWLIDAITSHQGRAKVRKEEFQVWKLQVLENGKGILTCTDGHEDSPEVTRQIIPFTDFPLKEITLWLERGSIDGKNITYVLMLPGER